MIKLINIVINRAAERLITFIGWSDLFKGVADRIPLDGLARAVDDNLSYTTLANTLDIHKVAKHLDLDDLAKHLDYATLVESFPEGFDYEQVARNIDASELVEHFVFSDRQYRTMMREFDYGKFNATFSSNDYEEIAKSLNYADLSREIDYSKLLTISPAEVVKKATEVIIDELDMTVFARSVGEHFGEDAYRQVAALVDYRALANVLVAEHGRALRDLDPASEDSEIREEKRRWEATRIRDIAKQQVEETLDTGVIEARVQMEVARLRENLVTVDTEKVRDEVKAAVTDARVNDIFATEKANVTLIDRLLDRAASMLLDRAAALAESGEVS